MKVEKYFCEGVRGNSDCRGCGAKDVPPDYVRTKTTMSGQCVMLNLLGKSEIATRLQGLRPTLRLYTYQESD